MSKIENKIGIVIQARTGSTRLKNKITTPFYQRKSILELLLERLNEIETPIIISTTSNEKDKVIVNIASENNLLFFMGDEHNVLDRFIKTAEYHGIEKIIRVCSDNPFLDVQDLEKQINDFKKSNADYTCYALSNGKPSITTHYGFWAEAVTLDALKRVQKEAKNTFFTEHVTSYIYTHPSLFKIERVFIPQDIENSSIRLTIDTKEDFDLASEIYSYLNKKNVPLVAKEIVKIVNTRPEWLEKMKSEILKNEK